MDRMTADEMQRTGLSASIADCVGRFSDTRWHERKRAVETLTSLIGQQVLDGRSMEALLELLLDAMGDSGNINSRAASHEVLRNLGRVSVLHVVDRLRQGGANQRLLVDLVGEIGGETEVPVLCEVLESCSDLRRPIDENLIASALAALGRIGGHQAILAVSSVLDHPSPMLRLYAVDALREAGATVQVDMLRPLLAHAVTRKVTARLLGVGGLESAVPLLVDLLRDNMRGVRSAAAIGLVRLAENLRSRGDVAHGAAAIDPVSAALRGIDTETADCLRDLIGDQDPATSGAAVVLAGHAADRAALPAVLARMRDPEIFERAVDLVEALGGQAEDVLVQMAAELELSARESMYRLIGALPGPGIDGRLTSILMNSLEDPSLAVVGAACDALSKVGCRAAIAPLYRCCGRDGGAGERAAEALAELLGRTFGSGGHHDDLELIIGGSWPHVGALACNLCRVVGRLGLPHYVPPLVAMLGSSDKKVRIAAALALGSIDGDHEGIAALSFSLADEDASVRAAASRSLGVLRAPQSCQALLSATSDPTPLVRAAAVQALVAMDNPVSLGRMREVILEDPSPTVVVHAIAALGRFGMDQDLALLMSLCRSHDHEVVKAAARSLAEYPLHRATAALLGLISHPRWDVRWAAAEVLGERRDRTALAPLRRAYDTEQDALVRQIIEGAIALLERPNQGDSD